MRMEDKDGNKKNGKGRKNNRGGRHFPSASYFTMNLISGYTTYLRGSALMPTTGLLLSWTCDATMRNVPSPPAVKMTSAQWMSDAWKS